ncbi:MAG: hypothetical protein JXQ82_04185 [Methanomicrobiaceae archaeon]|nr:hypothetical protein [Methanomicrobiaceae archaeon]
MAFEETLIFYNPLDAENFSKKLRDEGSRTKTRTVKTLVKDTVCKAEINNFREFFIEESENFKDDESEISAIMRETYAMVISELESMEGHIKEFLDLRDDGECISDDPDVGRFLETLKERDGISKLGELALEGDEFASRMMRIIPVLEENGMVETRDDKKYLKKTKDVKELVTTMPSDILLEGSSNEARMKYGIKTIVSVMSGSEYHVTTPAEFAFKTDLNELDGLVGDFSVEEESFIRLKENIFLKTLIAGRIMDFLKEKGKAGTDEITEEIKDVRISVKETGDEFAFDLERDYINEIIADMKKLDIIKGKGNRFRI